MPDWILILAAGASTRFNGVKALAPWAGGTLLSHALATAKDTGAHVMVVGGAHREEIAPSLQGVTHVFNPDWANGVGRSISVGVQAIQAQSDAVSTITMFPVDQPFVTSAHLAALATLAKTSGRCAFTASGKAVGPPAAIPPAFFAAAARLNGNQGLKHTLQPHQIVQIENAAMLYDIDTFNDWQLYSRI